MLRNRLSMSECIYDSISAHGQCQRSSILAPIMPISKNINKNLLNPRVSSGH
ncbi:hypothetical protein BJX70DRAFT_380997 [Aspergillus crustosus]